MRKRAATALEGHRRVLVRGSAGGGPPMVSRGARSANRHRKPGAIYAASGFFHFRSLKRAKSRSVVCSVSPYSMASAARCASGTCPERPT